MNPGIFLIQSNDDLVEMDEQPYDSEDVLQTLLAKYPSLLAGHQIDPEKPRRWLLVKRECGVPSEEGGGGRWSIDHLFLDQDAIPTFVEVKQSTNTDIRRKIVGQMMDYAANAVVYWPVERMRERFAQTHGPLADLQERNIRLLFVADEIPTELQRIVEFLNEQMDRTEVLAVEIKQFIGGEQTGLVPRVIGQTAEAQQKKSIGSSSRTNEDEFFQALEARRSPDEVDIARQLLNWCKENFSRISWAGSSFVPELLYDSNVFSPIAVGKSKSGRVQIRFGHIKRRNVPFDVETTRLEFLRQLNGIPGITLTEDAIDRFPNILLSTLTSGDALDQFLRTIAWSIQEVKAAQQQGDIAVQSRSTS